VAKVLAIGILRIHLIVFVGILILILPDMNMVSSGDFQLYQSLKNQSNAVNGFGKKQITNTLFTKNMKYTAQMEIIFFYPQPIMDAEV
jgi:hypothetical protein